MNALRSVVAKAAERLALAGIDSARTDAELLAAHAAGIERGRLPLLEAPDSAFFERFGLAVATRAQRVPLQHITGRAAFGPIDVEVGPGVFIPRPETEAMLEWALGQRIPPNPVILDLCTGSGALAVALSASVPDARVIAVDNDTAALEYARRNTAGTAVELLFGDVTDPDLLAALHGAVHLVVANPPYIPDGATLEVEVAQYDPAHALFGGVDGLAVIEPIVGRAARWLAPGGLVAIEHDDSTAHATVGLLATAQLPGSAVAAFAEITSHRDLAGRPRFVTARRGESP